MTILPLAMSPEGFLVSMTVSSTLDKNLSSQEPLSSSADVLLPRPEVDGWPTL